jgi:hypothetical protein
MTYDMSFQTDGWYDWNVREWGTKWDACDSSFDDNTEDKGPNLYYSFNTAWSIPEQVYKAITEQHPELDFEFYCEEEQGWGAEYKSTTDEDGSRLLELVKEWDIPDSHQDYVDRDRTCNCENDDDQDYWYDDCPRPETDFVVVVERRYIVKAQTAESAWDIAQDTLNELTPEDGSESFRVLDEHTGEHLFPKYEESEA